MTAPVKYTTTIDAAKTVGEIQTMLGRNGADAVAMLYEDGVVTGISFMLRGRQFRLPVDIDAMHRLLVREGKAGRLSGMGRAKYESPEQAARVAWRVVKAWLEAQLSLVAAQMVRLDEIMLPFLVVDGDRTLRDQWNDRQELTT